MATGPKFPVKSRIAPKTAPISLKHELEAEESVAESTTGEFEAAPSEEIVSVAAQPIEPGTVLEPVAEPAPAPAVVKTAVAVSVSAPGSFGGAAKAAADLDPSEWPLKTLDLLNENAAAVLDLALALGKAQSVSDAIEVQSRFASERYSTFVRQTNEFVELTRRLALEASAPVRLSISAFVA